MTALAKMTITPEPDSNLAPIEVLFNPNTYSVTKSVSWSAATAAGQGGGQSDRRKNAPALQFGGGQSRALSLDLFFDTTEETDDAKKDVRNLTNKIVSWFWTRRTSFSASEIRRPPVWPDAPPLLASRVALTETMP